MGEHTEHKDQIVICKYCNKPEYWGKMRWLSGRCTCRNCYRADYEHETSKPYTWDDLDGARPTMEEYQQQEAGTNRDERYF